MTPRAYVVHLSWATARRERLEPQLQRSGLAYEFVEGVDGRKLTDVERTALIDVDAASRAPTWLTPGVLGATLGHKCAYDAIVDAGDDVALVLENDAEIPAGFADLVSQLAAHVGAGEVMLLNFRSARPIELRRSGSLPCRNRQILDPVDPSALMSACAYLLRGETAARMRDAMMPVRWAPDSWGSYMDAGAVTRLRCVFPQPVLEDITTRSLARHGTEVTGPERLQQTTIFPVQALRILNRYRIRRHMTRVRIVD